MKKAIVTLIILCLLLGACYRMVPLGKEQFRIPSSFPTFEGWNGMIVPVYLGERINIFAWQGQDPKDERVFVELYFFLDEKTEGSAEMFLIVTYKGDKEELKIYVDELFLKTGTPSRNLSPVDNLPDFEELVRGLENKYPTNGPALRL